MDYKKGFTIVELLISMAVFSICLTICVGAFVSISNVRNLTHIERESQQKIRVAMEMINKLSRQAEMININKLSENDKYVELYYGSKGFRFKINPRAVATQADLYYHECFNYVENSGSCDNWGSGAMLVGYPVTLNTSESSFNIMGGYMQPALQVTLNGKYLTNSNKFYFTDETIKFQTTALLENIR